MTGLFDKYGGLTTFSRLTANFHVKINFSPYFTGIDVEKLLLHMCVFLAEALGGPKITGEEISKQSMPSCIYQKHICMR